MYEKIICPATEQYPRNTEGDVEVLPDGRLLLAYTRFEGGASDFDRASIMGRYSEDKGRSWGEEFTLHGNDGKVNCMSASLLQIPDGDLLLFFLRKNSPVDLQLYVKRSEDRGTTWGEPLRVTDGSGYYVMNNARVVRLASGRLIAPVARCEDAKGPVDGTGHLRSSCYYSDDNGETWNLSETWLDLPKRGAMEPGVAELRDGSLIMILRTQLGRIYQATSKDGGQTWGDVKITTLISPESPATVATIPANGDLLIVWNHNYDRNRDHGGIRAPLFSAVSSDDGYQWYRFRALEMDVSKQYAYTSITFVEDEVLLTYYQLEEPGKLSLKLKVVPLAWFYEVGDELLKNSIAEASNIVVSSRKVEVVAGD